MPRYQTRVAAKQAFRDALDFTVFQPIHFENFGTWIRGSKWDLFLVEPDLNPLVEHTLELHGIDIIDFEPQRDDSEAPKGFDDFDACIEALGEGYWLCKVPDGFSLSRRKFFRLYVVRSVSPPEKVLITV